LVEDTVVVVAVGMWVTRSAAESYPHTHRLALGIDRAGPGTSPGVIRWGRLIGTVFFDHGVNLFAVDNFRLTFLLMEDGKFEGFGFVKDKYLTSGIFTNSDLGIAQGIRWPVSLDLINDFLELEGQIFRDCASFLPTQDLSQVFKTCQRSMSVMLAAR
jgi:hypothetical protein